jgi:hypothetical protein
MAGAVRVFTSLFYEAALALSRASPNRFRRIIGFDEVELILHESHHAPSAVGQTGCGRWAGVERGLSL